MIPPRILAPTYGHHTYYTLSLPKNYYNSPFAILIREFWIFRNKSLLVFIIKPDQKRLETYLALRLKLVEKQFELLWGDFFS